MNVDLSGENLLAFLKSLCRLLLELFELFALLLDRGQLFFLKIDEVVFDALVQLFDLL